MHAGHRAWEQARVVAVTCAAAILCASTNSLALEPDVPGQVATLPEQYPPHWILVHDVAFGHMLDGRTYIMDADADRLPLQKKGMINGSLVAQIAQATKRPEIYVAETFYSRGNRGERTDVVTIYDKRTLTPIDEVVLGNSGRAMVLPHKFALQFTDDERLLLIYNFSPAMSVNVVDLDERAVVNEITLPGCAPVYPTGQRGFSALCGEGALFTALLDETGEVTTSARTEPFFDVDSDALFERPAWVSGVGHFPTFTGNLVSIDFRSDSPVISPAWSMVDESTSGWRPGGVEPADADADGIVYVLMHPDGGEGSQSAPGFEIWRIDAVKRKRLDRLPLRMPGLSVAVTRDQKNPLLIVTNVEMALDVYDARSGDHLRTLSDFGGETPLLVFGAR